MLFVRSLKKNYERNILRDFLPDIENDPRMVHKSDKTVLKTVHKAQTTATPIFLPFNSVTEIIRAFPKSLFSIFFSSEHVIRGLYNLGP